MDFGSVPQAMVVGGGCFHACFLSKGKQASGAVEFQLSLSDETVESTDPDQPLAVTSSTPLRDVLLMMKAQHSGCVLICDGGKLGGIFTERDALRVMAKVSGGSDAVLSEPISMAMSAGVGTLANNATMGHAIRQMASGRFRRLPIIDANGEPKGVADVRGIVHYLVEHFPETVYNLPPNPQATTAEREGA